MARVVTRVSTSLNGIIEYLIAALAAFFTGLLIISVFSRYICNFSIVTSVEMTRISFCWAVFLAASCVAARGAHVRVVFFVSLLPNSSSNIMAQLVHAVVLAFGIAMVWYGYVLTARVADTFFPTLQISQSWMYSALPVSGLLIVLHSLAHVLTPAPSLTQGDTSEVEIR